MGHRSEKDWEGVAFGLWREIEEPVPPSSALQLAADCGLRVVAGGRRGRARLVGDTIQVNPAVRPVRLHGLVAHELGHWALRRAGEADCEAGASYVGAALMLPRVPYERDLVETSWDLDKLRAKHVHCSAEMLARRLVALRDAASCIWDNGKLTGRHVSPWFVHRKQFGTITPLERELAGRVLERGETVRLDDLVWGFPVFDQASGWRRVITMVEAEQLALRW